MLVVLYLRGQFTNQSLHTFLQTDREDITGDVSSCSYHRLMENVLLRRQIFSLEHSLKSNCPPTIFSLLETNTALHLVDLPNRSTLRTTRKCVRQRRVGAIPVYL